MKGEFLTNEGVFHGISYEIVSGINKYKKSECIIVKTLDPDYYLLFGTVKLIITENGSRLSHLAIVAIEQGISVYLCPNIIGNVKKIGSLTLDESGIKIE